MKKWNRWNKLLAVALAAASVTGCAGSRPESAAEENIMEEETADTVEPGEAGGIGIGSMTLEETAPEETKETASVILRESAQDAQVDFRALKEENPEIFAWIYIPDTSIDAPVAQSGESDEYYASHNITKENDENGALYIEAANLTSMCDFNTVIHGNTAEDGESGLFAELYQFSDPDYFDSHEQMYLYLEDNVLTYEIFAAYERENNSLIRTYDFTYLSGCDQFLKDMYSIRSMNMMIRSGWEDVTPYHFLVTLTTSRGKDSDSQFVVLAALIEDPAGTIDRAVME
ncbi:MAG: class B sortase [Lachnospiraceae bacterium]|nr:class B sortase [Lachnospiraceae bacterium]